jgi:hypothetical protein
MMMDARVESKSLLYDLLLPKLEIASWLLAIWGFIARWYQVVGGAMFLIVGLGSLSVVYFLSAYKPRKTSTTNGPYFEPVFNQQQFAASTSDNASFMLDSLAPKLIGISGSVILIGTLFKLLFWTGAANMLIPGTGTMLLVILLMALNQRMSKRAIVLGAIGCVMLYVPSETWVRQFHRDDPELIALMLNQLHHPHDRAAAEAVRVHMHQKRANR